jgi:WD40 repeat protein
LTLVFVVALVSLMVELIVGLGRIQDTNPGAVNVHGESTQAIRQQFGLAFSPDSRHLAVTDHGGRIRVWDVVANQGTFRLEGHTQNVNSLAFSPDGTRLASASKDHTVRLWDLAQRKPLHVLQGHTEEVTAVAFSADGRQLVSASDDLTVRVWEVSTGRDVGAFTGHKSKVHCVACSAVDGLIASGNGRAAQRVFQSGANGLVLVWRNVTDERPAVRLEHMGPVWSVAFHPDGKRLATGSADMTVALWAKEDGKRLVIRDCGCAVNHVAYNPEGTRLAVGQADGVVTLRDSNNLNVLHSLRGHGTAVGAVAFSKDGKYLASASLDGDVRLWDAQTGSPVAPPSVP